MLINWQEGEKYFMEHLVDGDLASKMGLAVECIHWHRRSTLFSNYEPETQSMRFDPEGKYIKKWIPELKDCPISQIHMPENPEQYGYPKAMVDLKESRKKLLMFSQRSKVKITVWKLDILYQW